MSFTDSTVTYGGTYRAVCLEILPDRARVQVPQIFATEILVVYDFAGGRPQAGDEGWVIFENGMAERPVWAGSESKGGGGGVAAYPPYYATAVSVSVDSASGGSVDVVLLDGTVPAAYDGWVEVVVSGGYAGMSVQGNVNARQGILCPDYTDPTGQGWLSFGWLANVKPSTWEIIGDCQQNIPVVAGQAINLRWHGNWSPSAYVCSFRSMATVKFFSTEILGDGDGGTAGGGASHGLPAGGTNGQLLAKQSSSDYDTHWVTVSGLVNNYHHIQTVPSAVWTINHNLGFNPNVAVVDSTGREVIGEIQFINVNTVQVTFSAAFGGDAYLS